MMMNEDAITIDEVMHLMLLPFAAWTFITFQSSSFPYQCLSVCPSQISFASDAKQQLLQPNLVFLLHNFLHNILSMNILSIQCVYVDASSWLTLFTISFFMSLMSGSRIIVSFTLLPWLSGTSIFLLDAAGGSRKPATAFS